ncbi:glycosyltransferase [Phocaeicola plebeius]|uniref:glycosyltransferase n=1 Tax=Phocaeicola plebeius TaxID=310297 RepID=UPI0026F14CF8|nr:glycosyltransferase [Phocaeicola plebeius]MCI6051690.1 glycosyltransferase [Phocaeicola plebeius]MDD6913457.1 glycosyltransferase [Phocaeicola plebeius]MDY5977481.1 glycosyltransferase [Phocaeicola plebeius]
MNKNPLISVLLPLYNEPISLAKQAIDSILNQTFSHLEVILLLDNPKNTELINLIQDYEGKDNRVITHINSSNKGLPETLNAGIHKAKGKYIARMDGDDISAPTRIEKQLKFLLEHPHIDLVGSNAYAINEEGELIGEYHKLSSDFSQKMMLRHITINLIHPTWLGKIELFKNCLYRNFTHCEDYDFMMRAYALGYHFYNLQENLFYVRIQQKSLRSVSRKYAYEQYINTIRVQKQYKTFKRKKLKVYPELPELSYDAIDKEKYQSTIADLNSLREAFFQKQILKIISISIRISQKDSRPLIFRLKVLVLSSILSFMEKIKLIK